MKYLFLLFILIFPLGFASAEGLGEKLVGKILLQVESSGEAWYVSPDTGKRFFLGRPADAFEVMREQGLGISNADFDSYGSSAPARLGGKILLKVEDAGKAYYVNPDGLEMHYLGRPADAFKVMREQSLGITNSDLDRIEIDENSAPLIVEQEEADSGALMPDTETEVDTETDDPSAGSGQVEDLDTATTTEEEAVATTTEEEQIATTTEEAIATSSAPCVYLAEYYSNSKFIGEPVATRTEEVIDFDWGVGAPEGVSVNNKFSARWTATCHFEEGTYEFRTTFDDAIKVYLDNVNFMQNWKDNDKTMNFNRERMIEEGDWEVKVEYYENTGDANIKVDWEKIS